VGVDLGRAPRPHVRAICGDGIANETLGNTFYLSAKEHPFLASLMTGNTLYALPDHTAPYCTVLYCTVLYCTVLYCALSYSLQCHVLYRTHCTVLYRTHCTLSYLLQCDVLYRTHCNVPSGRLVTLGGNRLVWGWWTFRASNAESRSKVPEPCSNIPRMFIS
jgi:hypothetical protein